MLDNIHSLLETEESEYIYQGFELLESLELTTEEIQAFLHEHNLSMKTHLGSNRMLSA